MFMNYQKSDIVNLVYIWFSKDLTRILTNIFTFFGFFLGSIALWIILLDLVDEWITDIGGVLHILSLFWLLRALYYFILRLFNFLLGTICLQFSQPLFLLLFSLDLGSIK